VRKPCLFSIRKLLQLDNGRGTYFFFGLLACLAGLLIMLTDFVKRDEE
jgi:hypothetical protein